MGLIQNVTVLALFSGAYMSNPDEESFKKFLEIEYRRYLFLKNPTIVYF